MIRLVQSADAGKTKIVGMADRWATCTVQTNDGYDKVKSDIFDFIKFSCHHTAMT
jgi:hypothetical protein